MVQAYLFEGFISMYVNDPYENQNSHIVCLHLLGDFENTVSSVTEKNIISKKKSVFAHSIHFIYFTFLIKNAVKSGNISLNHC